MSENNRYGTEKYVGAHVSAAGGAYRAAENAAAIGAASFALFTKNQKQWYAPPLTEDDAAKFRKKLAESGIEQQFVLPHDSYLINLGNPEEEKREKSVKALLDEARRVETLGLSLLNFHPGAHLKEMSDEECLDLISMGMNRILAETSGVTLVVEGTSGQGSNVGYKFEHLKRLVDLSDDKSRVGVCLDTCHIFAAGYDLRTRSAYEHTMEEFGGIVGFQWLKGIHLNDAKSAYGSRVDRHACIGDGNLGLDAFRFIMNDPRLDGIPIVLETPDPDKWADEIKLLYSFTGSNSQGQRLTH